MAAVNNRPWDRIDGEDLKWFARFTAYRLLGPRRTVAETWRREPGNEGKEVSPTWHSVASEWNWKERAAAWDLHLVEEDGKAQAEQRRKLVREVFSVLADKLEELRDERIGWRDYIAALRIIMDELRTEYNQQTPLQVDVNIAHQQIIKKIADARGVDPNDLELEMQAVMTELGIGDQ